MVETVHRKCKGRREVGSVFQGQSRRLGVRSHGMGGNQEWWCRRGQEKKKKHFNKGMCHVAVNKVKRELNTVP